jgi:hypothetical protein
VLNPKSMKMRLDFLPSFDETSSIILCSNEVISLEEQCEGDLNGGKARFLR